MERTTFEKQLAAGKLSGVYLLDGNEEYLKQRALHRMIDTVCENALKELNSTIMENPTTDDLMAACETMPFMSEKRIVVVPDPPYLTGRSEADEALKDYLVHVPQSCVLVFICHGKVDARKALVKQIAKAGTQVTYSTLEETELNSFIRDAFKEAGKNCSVHVAAQLAFVAGSDAALLMNEIGKLVSLSGERDEITEEDIQAVTTRSAEYTAYEIVNAVMENKESKAFSLMRDMLSAGESRISILAMVERQYRMLQHVHIMRYEKKTQDQMAQLLGAKPFVVGKYLQQARAISARQARDSVKMCVDTEYAIKSGKLNQDGAVEALLLKLFEMRAPKAQA
ncbi:MAG: DNA polymerase III subunit delta [Clostridia bacterium]|nr:DNA polymerase III subunit delta [Clostridia bacterium]